MLQQCPGSFCGQLIIYVLFSTRCTPNVLIQQAKVYCIVLKTTAILNAFNIPANSPKFSFSTSFF